MNVAKLRIRLLGDPCLREKSLPMDSIGPAEIIFIEAMLKTMYETDGVGLAAPQIGVNRLLFVADMGEGPTVVINPKVIKESGLVNAEEGCLSCPGIVAKVDRSERIEVEYTDQFNQPVHREFRDLMARIFLHELDHCNGKLIVDYLSPQEIQNYSEQLEAIQQSSKENLT